MQEIKPEKLLTKLFENVNKNISIIDRVNQRNQSYILNIEYQDFLYALAENQEIFKKLTEFNESGTLQPVLETEVNPQYSVVNPIWFLRDVNNYISSMNEAADLLSMLPIKQGGIVDG